MNIDQMTFYAMLLSVESAEQCHYEGPFGTEQEAQDFVDYRNESLTMHGLPALWAVV